MLTSAISDTVTILSSPTGLLLIGVLASAAIVFWDWRVALVVIFFVQALVGVVTTRLAQVPVEWVFIQTAVMGLSCLILGMSAAQAMSHSPSARQAGSTWLRMMALLMLYGGWRLLDIQVNLPETDPGLAQLYGWLGLCALLMLGLGSNPFYGGVAVLFWITIVQGFVATVLEVPSLVALVGILELIVALACSYLLIAERAYEDSDSVVLTDITFPSQAAYMGTGLDMASVTGSITSAMGRGWLDRVRKLLVTPSGKVTRDSRGDVKSVSQDERRAASQHDAGRDDA